MTMMNSFMLYSRTAVSLGVHALSPSPLLHVTHILVLFDAHMTKKKLSDGESNPGLPRDRRGY